MDENAIVILIIGSVAFIGFDMYFVCSHYKLWVKNKMLEKDTFIFWRGTKKSFVWWAVWSSIMCTNIVPFLSVSLYFGDQVYVGYSAIITFLAYVLGGLFIYTIIKLIVQALSKQHTK